MPKPASAEVVTPALLREWRLPDPKADKESSGRILVVGGTRETPGAIRLAAEAALRVGAGKLQVITVAAIAPLVALALPEALVRGVAEDAAGCIDPAAVDDVLELADGAGAVLLGPGMAGESATRGFVAAVLSGLESGEQRVLLDALALAVVGVDPECLHPLSGRTVLTPNLKELALCLNRADDEVRRDVAGAASDLASATGAVVAAGGSTAWTAAADGRVWSDPHGGEGLGVSGSGDVLAGVIAGLLARGADPPRAAVWGVHLHSRAGDRLAGSVGRIGYLARELPAQIPRVLAELAG